MKPQRNHRRPDRDRRPYQTAAVPKKEDVVLKCTLFRCWLALVVIAAGLLVGKINPTLAEQTKNVYHTLLNAPIGQTTEVWRQTAEEVGLTILLGRMEESIMVYAGQGGEQNWNEESLPDNVSENRPVFSAPASAPVNGILSCVFGPRIHPVSGGSDFHTGIDIAAVGGSAIYAAWPGVVQNTGSSAIYGNYITIDHGGGLVTAYCHCRSVLAQPGVHLRAGERIATVGSTGISTGNHLHFEVRLKEKCVDPLAAFDL
ncbi:MAG: M23 family metallopeptidase [Oscillospiraceae bacterium]|nr:M23 family metallopeptidase [Oscillospiraceae bacterium]